jgi:hypothetical protein
MLRRVLLSVVTLIVAMTGGLLAQPPQPPEGFVPVSQLPPGQELPAAPFLVGAYVFFLLLMMFYLWTVWKRIGKVEEEMRALQQKSGARR